MLKIDPPRLSARTELPPILRELAKSTIEIKKDRYNQTKKRKGSEKSAKDELSQEMSGKALHFCI